MGSTTRHRRAFSLVEMMVVCSMMAVLAVLLSSAWAGVGKTAADLIGRSRLVQERDLAVAALSRDLGGYLSATSTGHGERRDGRWLKWEIPTPQSLMLYFDGGTNASGVALADTTVKYLLAPDSDPTADTKVLVRRMSVSGGAATDFVVARKVYSMNVAADADDPTAVRIILCFKYRTPTLTCDLTAKPPSDPPGESATWTMDQYTQP